MIRPRPLTSLIASLLSLPVMGLAQSTWQHVGISWGDPNSWSPNSVPNNSSAEAVFPAAAGNSYVDLGGSGFTVNKLTFQSGTGALYGVTHGTLALAGTNATVTAGANSPARFNTSLGAFSMQLNSAVTMDVAAGSTLLFESGTTITGSGSLTKTGAGTLELQGSATHTGGTVVRDGTLDINSGGSVNHPASTFYVGQFTGDTGHLVVQSGGTITSAGGYVGKDAGANSNTAVITGSGSSWTSSNILFVGDLGASNSLSVLAGGHVNSAGGFVGNQGANNTALVSGPGSTWTNTGIFAIGNWGNSNSLQVEAGGHVVTQDSYIGAGYLGDATKGNLNSVTIDGTGSNWTSTGNVYLGVYGSGNTLNLTNGGTFSSNTLMIGTGDVGYPTTLGRDNSVTVTGAGSSLTANTITVGYFGRNNSLTVADGAKVTAGSVVIAANSTATGSLHLNGTAGSRGVLETNSITDATGAGHGQIYFDGGILRATSSSANLLVGFNPGTVHINAGGAFIDTNGFTTTIGTAMDGTGALTKQGLGTLTLSGTNTYTGGTVIEGGTLSVSSDANLGAASGSLTFNGGTLQTTASFTTNRSTVLLTGGTFAVQTGTTLTHQGTISGPGSLTKVNAGTLILSGSNTYTGGTIINGGTVSISSDANLGDASGSLTLDGGTLQTTGSLLTFRATTLGAGNGAIATGSGTVFNHQGVISGPGGLIKTGTGSLILGGANTYTGGTAINAGTISISSDANLGDASGSLSFNGGTLQSTADLTTSRYTVLQAGGGTFDTAPGTTLNHQGFIDGTGSLTKTGLGTLVLGNANNYQGGTIINGGTVSISADANLGNVSGSLTLNGGTLQITADLATARNTSLQAGGGTFETTASTTFAHLGTISGSGSLTKTGAGNLVLDGTNSYTGGTVIREGLVSVSADANLGHASGTLSLEDATLQTTASFTTNRGTSLLLGGGAFDTAGGTTLTHNGVISGSGAFTKIGTGDLVLGGANTYTGGTSILGGRVSISSDANLGAAAASLNLDGGTLRSTADLTSNRATTLGAGNGGIEVNTGTTFTHTGTISGSGALIKTGDGTLALTGTNTYAGGTAVTAGTLSVSADENLGDINGAVFLSDGTLHTANSFTSNRTIVMQPAGGILDTASGTKFTHTGTITGSGSVTKTGTGTLELQGNNTYTGGTKLKAGAVAVSADANLGDASSTLDFDGGTLQTTATFATARATTLSAGGGTIETVGPTVLLHTGTISGSGSLTKTGEGALVLTGSNTYTGGTAINEGVVSVSSNANLGDASGTLSFDGGTLNTSASFTSGRTVTLQSGGGTFDVDSATTLTQSGTVGGSGALTKTGLGTLVLSGANTYTGGTNLLGGVLSISADNHLGSGGTLLIDGATLQTTASFTTTRGTTLGSNHGAFDVATGTTFNHGGVIGGTGTLYKLGAGTLILSGTNTYTGGTAIGGGIVSVSADANLGDASGSLLLDGGTLAITGFFTTNRATTLGSGNGQLTVSGGQTFTHAGVISGTGALLSNGPGTLVLSGTNTYTGGTSFSNGTLSISTDSNLGAASGGLLLADATLHTTADLTTARDTFLDPGTVLFSTDNATTFNHTGYIGGDGALTKVNGGILVLSGANSYAGGTTIQAGVISISANANLGATTSHLTMDGGTLQTTANVLTTRGTTLTTNPSNFEVAAATTFSHQGVIDGAGDLNKTGDGTLILGGTNTYTGDTRITQGTLSVSSSANLGASGNTLELDGGTLQVTESFTNTRFGTLGASGGTFEVAGGKTFTQQAKLLGVGQLTKTGEGILSLTGANTFSGGLLFKEGLVAISADTNLGAAGNTLTFDGGGLRNTADFTNTRTTTLAAGGGTIDVVSGKSFTQQSTITGAGQLTKTGAGVLELTGANAHLGGTAINGGTVVIGGDDALGDAGATLTLNGGTLQTITAFTSHRAISLQAGNGAFDVDADPLTLAGVISGPGGLIKLGSETLTLTGNNTYSGGTAINGGKVIITSNANLGDASGALSFNTGTLQTTGTIISDRVITIQGGGATFHTVSGSFTQNGVIDGSGMLVKTGSGLLTLSGANTYSGGTLLKNGIISITSDANLGADGGSITFDGGTLRTYGDIVSNRPTIFAAGGANFDIVDGTYTQNGNVSGPGALTKRGDGILILNGRNTFSGPTTVYGGSLVVEGALVNSVVGVDPSGKLGGKGRITASVVNRGLVSPGNSPGTLIIGGDFTQKSIGITEIEFAGRAREHYDHLLIAGMARLGGTLHIIRLNRFQLRPGDDFTFLYAAGGVFGKYANVNNELETGTIVSGEIEYRKRTVALVAVQNSFTDTSELIAKQFPDFRFGDLTENQQTVARNLDRVIDDRRSSKLAEYLNQQLLPELPGDFDRIAPEELSAVFQVSVSLANVQSRNLQRRLEDIRAGRNGFSSSGLAIVASGPAQDIKPVEAPAPDSRWGTFITGTGEWVNVGDTANARGYDLQSGGVTAGFDYRFTPRLAVGISAGYVGTNADLTNGGRVDINGAKLGAYGTYFDGGFHVDAAANVGYQSYDTRRSALRGKANGDTDGTEFNCLLGTGYDWQLGALTVGPTASFQYTRVSLDEFTEHGSLAPLEFKRNTGESLRSSLGFHAAIDWRLRGVILRPEFRAAWQREYGDAAYSIDSSFANGSGNTFSVSGPKLGRDSVLLGAGVSMQWNERTATYLYYDGQLGQQDYDSSSVSGGLRLSF